MLSLCVCVCVKCWLLIQSGHFLFQSPKMERWRGYTKRKHLHVSIRMFISLNVLSTLTFLLSHSCGMAESCRGDEVQHRQHCEAWIVFAGHCQNRLESGTKRQKPPGRKPFFIFCCNCSLKLFWKLRFVRLTSFHAISNYLEWPLPRTAKRSRYIPIFLFSNFVSNSIGAFGNDRHMDAWVYF
jgi:hypothetical protein